MAQLRHTSKRKALTPGERCELYTGRNYFAGEVGFLDEESRRTAWVEHGERLLAEWIADRSRAGRRPAAWWQYEAPEPRNPAEEEQVQLERLGLLQGAEHEQLEQRRRLLNPRVIAPSRLEHGATPSTD